MNKKMWNLYKDSEEGKKVIELFNPETENVPTSVENLFDYAKKWGIDSNVDRCIDLMILFEANLSLKCLLPNESFTRETFENFVMEFSLVDYEVLEDGSFKLLEDAKATFVKKDNYRLKAGCISELSLFLFYTYEYFKPILFPQRFDIIQRKCDTLGIEQPPLPISKDYKAYLMYYYDLCAAFNDYQKENELTDAEFCACLYDFSTFLQEETDAVTDLPKPTNVWLTGSSGKMDFSFLDSLGTNTKFNQEKIWACNERTKRGDIIVVYCNSPRSYIHSIWRADSNGVFNPFDFYHCRTNVSNGIRVPEITFNDLKNDTYFSQVPIVRRNLQGINGIELSARDYSELLRLIKEKGGKTDCLPKLFEGTEICFGEIKLEKDVEEKILIPMLKKIGYQETDWTRQLSQKAGRSLKAIPDFVFFPKGEKHFSSAPLVIEVKLDMSLMTEQQNAFSQGLSYARLLRSSLMGICDKERLIIYKVDKNGSADRRNPIFEDHWVSIYGDSVVGARLNQIIGREVVKII